MAWWVRGIVTLVVTPFLWMAGALYGQYVLGTEWPDLLQAAQTGLVSTFTVFTLPALALCVVLFGVDWLLDRAGLILLTVITSPLIALVIALVVLQFTHPEEVGPTGEAVGLFTLYGAIWGLTIREVHKSLRRRLPARTDRPTTEPA